MKMVLNNLLSKKIVETLVVFLLILFLIPVHGQKKVLSKNEAIEDLEYLHYYLTKWHPSYYRYSSESDYEIFYNHFVQTCPDSIPYRLFRYRVAEWVKIIGCGHTSVGHANFNTKGQTPKILPFNIWKIGNKAFVRSMNAENSDCKVGDEILTIDSYSAENLLDSMYRMVSGDGFQDTHVEATVERYFNFYYNHLFGSLDSVTLACKNEEGTVKKEKIPCTSLSANTAAKMRFPVDSSSIVFQGGGMSLHKIEGRPDVSLLKIESFGKGNQSRIRKKIFSWLKRNNIKHLIVDLRGNGGGNVFRGYALAEKLLPDENLKIQFGKKIHTAIFNPELEIDWGNRVSGASFMLNPWQFPKGGLWMHYFPVFTSHNNRFDGEVFVLVDGGTFSMGSSLASLLKHKGGAQVIGEESGGSEYGSGGMLTGALRTPNSGIPVSFNLYWFIIGASEKDTGRGVLPKIETHYNLKDRLLNRDKDLEAALQLIDHNKTIEQK